MGEADFSAVPVDDPCVGPLLADYERELVGLGVVLNHGSSGGTPAEDFLGDRGRFVVVQRAGEVLGCGGVRLLDAATAEIKRMYVVPAARGQGLARLLLRHLEGVARELGARTVRMDTGADMTSAVRLYRSAGYGGIEDYNGNPDAGWWFEKALQES